MAEDYLPDVEKAAKHAKQMAVLAILAAAVVAAVLFIDLEIKKSVLAQAIRARDLLDEARKLAEEARNGAAPAGEAGSTPGAPVDGGNGVVRDAAAGAVLDQTGSDQKAAPARVKTRPADRAPRNG